MTASLILVALVSLPFVAILVRRPVLRRLALRNAVRRPREAALVVLGSLLGAAIITGSAVVGDTMDASIRQVARTHLGPIDELVTAREPRRAGAAPPGAAAARVGQHRRRPRVRDDRGRGHQHRGLASAPRRAPSCCRSTSSRRARFGGDADATGISGPTPEVGRAAITADVARALAVGAGGRIAVHAYGIRTVARRRPRPAAPRCRRVLARPRAGGAQRARLAEDVRRDPGRRRRRACRRPGGSRSPTAAASRAERCSRTRSSAQIRAAAAAAGLDPQIYPVKRTTLDVAEAVGKGFASMFTAMGSFGVLAGLLLLVNLFVMLAAERKTELGMARAVGMRRSRARRRVRDGRLDLRARGDRARRRCRDRARRACSSRSPPGSSRPSTTASTSSSRCKPQSLAQSFAIAFVVALATIVATSLRVSRLNIIRAIRDLAEPPPRAAARSLARRRRARRRGRHRADAPGLVVARRLRAPARAEPRRRRARAARAPPPPGRRPSTPIAALLVVVLGRVALRARPRVDEGRQRHALRRPGDRADDGGRDAGLAPAGASEPSASLR